MKPSWIVVPLLFAVAVCESSCQKKVAAPLPPVPAAQPATVPDTTQETTPPPATPPATPAPARRPSRPAAPSTPPANTPPASQQPLRLGDMLTPEQQRQYNTAIDQALGRAQANLAAVANRQLTNQQQATLAQVQNFIEQAQTTRRSDLAGAKSLAERADVLARDLAKSVR